MVMYRYVIFGAYHNTPVLNVIYAGDMTLLKLISLGFKSLQEEIIINWKWYAFFEFSKFEIFSLKNACNSVNLQYLNSTH